LVGFAFEAGGRVHGLQPIFRGNQGIVPGGAYSSPDPRRAGVVKAQTGYSVGGMEIYTGGVVDGFQLTFMRDRGDGLDPNDTYKSPWIGVQRGTNHSTFVSPGQPIVGVYGSYEDDLNSLGFILDSSNVSEPRAAGPTKALPPDPALVMTFEPETIVEDGVRKTVRDLSGNNLHGSLTGGTLVGGRAGKALLFNRDGYITIPDHPLLKGGGDITITVAYWFRVPHGMWGGMNVSKCWDAAYKDWNCGASPSSFGYTSERNGGDYRLSYVNHLGHGWNHVAFVLDQPSWRLQLYVNGKMIQEDARLGNISAPTRASLNIGRSYYTGSRDNEWRSTGLIDELVIYRRALTNDEIQTLVRHGLGGKPLRDDPEPTASTTR